MTKTTESKWRALIAEQESSGLTVREFAATGGVAAGSVFWWRSRLRRRSAEAIAAHATRATWAGRDVAS